MKISIKGLVRDINLNVKCYFEGNIRNIGLKIVLATIIFFLNHLSCSLIDLLYSVTDVIHV